jgi:hypothetical protein
MVRIEHTKQDLQTLAENHYAELCLPAYAIADKLQVFRTTAAPQVAVEHSAFAQLLDTHLEDIIVSWPDELEKLKPTLASAFRKVLAALAALPGLSKKDIADSKQQYKQKLAEAFDYKRFTSNYSGYGAYRFTQNLNVNVCPYCNRQYTFTLDKKSGRTRPELDHFLDKATHPYFGLSFFNLIPSCHICNSNLKGSKAFTNDTYLNPYTTCFNDVLNFSIDIKAVDFINGKVNSFTISQKPAPNASKKLVKKAERNAAVFQHSELYNNHQDLVKELILKAYHYTPERRAELFKLTAKDTGQRLFQDEAEVNRFITGVYTEVAEIGKRPMSKLIRDIGRELKLL